MDGWRSFTWIYVGMGDLRPKKQKVVGDGRHISFIIQVIVVKAGASLQMFPPLLHFVQLIGPHLIPALVFSPLSAIIKLIKVVFMKCPFCGEEMQQGGLYVSTRYRLFPVLDPCACYCAVYHLFAGW